jgi:2-dehydropantoate 2-reductase
MRTSMSEHTETQQPAMNESNIHPRLRFLCYGVGAIGTYIGGSLALSGQDVVFIERPGPAQEVLQRGLRLRIGEEERSFANPQIVTDLDEAMRRGPYDAIILAVKSFDTQGVIDRLMPYRASIPSFLSLQNGVENEALLSAAFGADKVIAASVLSAVGRRATGDILLERLRGIGIYGGHSLSRRLETACNQAGLKAKLYASAESMKWSKMITNLMSNATSAILDMTPAEVFADPALFQLELAQLRECLDVMKAQGIGVVNLPGTPVQALAWAVRSLPPALSQPFIQRAVGSGRGGKMPSFHIDLHAGRGTSEVDYLNGAVVRFGARYGISTPVNRALTETLLALTRGELKISDFSHQPKRLLDRVRMDRT